MKTRTTFWISSHRVSIYFQFIEKENINYNSKIKNVEKQTNLWSGDIVYSYRSHKIALNLPDGFR